VDLQLTVSLAGSGYHPASWQFSPLRAVPDARAIQAMARTAERGKLDAIFLGLPVDAPAPPDGGANTIQLDPLSLLGSLIGVTTHIGLGAAWRADYTEPYHAARVFATLDHLSSGRTAWIGRMFGAAGLASRIGRPGAADHPAAAYAHGAEFIDVVKKLWDSWEDGAFALDKASGMFVDPERVHPINHIGKFFAVRGPLNVPRPPQGNPVLVQIDPATSIGRRFAAETADVLLTPCVSMAEAIARYRELRALAAESACDPSKSRVLANLSFVLGETPAMAQRRAADLDALIPFAGPRFVGTAQQLADLLVTWRGRGACDGFNLMPAVLPVDLDLLVGSLIPILQRNGQFRRDYVGVTLREHLGLARPRSQYEAPTVEPSGT